MTRPGACPVCLDPTCPIRDGTFVMAYHWLEMLHEAYDMNGTPRSDAVLMGVASLQEMVDTFGVTVGAPVDLNPDAEYACVYPNDPAWPDAHVVAAAEDDYLDAVRRRVW